MTDRQNGLIKVVSTVFLDAEQRHCVRQIYQNFHKKHKGKTLKNDLWSIARKGKIQDKEMEKPVLEEIVEEL
jgi:hypothetical protein